jgi:hypothetical protein
MNVLGRVESLERDHVERDTCLFGGMVASHNCDFLSDGISVRLDVRLLGNVT